MTHDDAIEILRVAAAGGPSSREEAVAWAANEGAGAAGWAAQVLRAADVMRLYQLREQLVLNGQAIKDLRRARRDLQAEIRSLALSRRAP